MKTNFKFGKDATAYANQNNEDEFKLVQEVSNAQYVATFISSFHTKDEIKAGLTNEFFLSKTYTGPDGKTYAEFREVTNHGISMSDLLKD